MKVLLCAPSVSNHAVRFLDNLLAAGHRVVFVDDRDPRPEGAPGYEFIPYHPGGLRALAAAARPDVVHVQWIDERAVAWAEAGARPLVFSCWGSDINKFFPPDSLPLAAAVSRFLERVKIGRALAAADAVTAESLELLERCEILAGKKLNARRLYFGIDLERFRPARDAEDVAAARAEMGLPEGRLLLSARALRPIMRHHEILEAFASLAKRPAGQGLRLVFIRHPPVDEEYEARLAATARRLGVEDRVMRLSAVDYCRMPRLYAAVDAVVNYPETDGFPITLLEAAASGLPIVSARRPAYEDFFGTRALWTADGGGVPALARALEACFDASPGERQSRLEEGRRRVIERADRRKCAAELENFYAGLMAGAERARR